MEPDVLAAYGYDLVMMLNQIKDKEDVKTALYEVNIEGINGNISFNEYGEIDMPLVVVEAEGRTIVN